MTDTTPPAASALTDADVMAADALVIARTKDNIEHLRALTPLAPEYELVYWDVTEGLPAAFDAALRRIAVLESEVAGLRGACEGVPDMLEGAADDNTAVLQMTSPLKAERDTMSDELRTKAAAIRAALAPAD